METFVTMFPGAKRNSVEWVGETLGLFHFLINDAVCAFVCLVEDYKICANNCAKWPLSGDWMRFM